MKTEDIISQWEKDREFDLTNLTRESADIPKLHNKYYQYYMAEGYKQRQMDLELKKFKQDKIDWYLGYMAEEDIKDYGWKPAPDRKYLKSDVKDAVDADQDVIDRTLRKSIQDMKVEYLEQIIRQINNRGFQLKTMVDWERFRTGSL